MKILILRSCVLGPEGVAQAGETVDVSDDSARRLIAMGRAQAVAAAPEPPVAMDTSAAAGLVPEGKRFARRRRD